MLSDFELRTQNCELFNHPRWFPLFKAAGERGMKEKE
jgi:hypothetical protein